MCLLASIFASKSSIAADDSNKWLPLSRTQITQQFEITKVDEVPGRTSGRVPIDVAALRNEGDTIWAGVNEKLDFRLAMAGVGENVHSIRLYIPVVNNSEEQNDKIFKMLVSFFITAFPDWPEAKNWPQESMSSSWSAMANEMEKKPFTPTAIITMKAVDGITVSTFGVPPDIVLYAATARQACIPRLNPTPSNPMNDPIQRLVC